MLLRIQPSRVTGQRMILANHPMTRYYDPQRIAVGSLPDGTGCVGLSNHGCNLTVGACFSVRNLADRLPYGFLKGRPMDGNGELKFSSSSVKILLQLRCGLI